VPCRDDDTVVAQSEHRLEFVPIRKRRRVFWSLAEFNADHVLETVFRRAEREPGLRRVVYDLSATPYLDVAGARILRWLHDDLAGQQIELRVAGLTARFATDCAARSCRSGWARSIATSHCTRR
jgi:hypothetical protein